ncbi:hypothetical protein GGI35DRAFT_279683 [Trichoderma velutinum]
MELSMEHKPPAPAPAPALAPALVYLILIANVPSHAVPNTRLPQCVLALLGSCQVHPPAALVPGCSRPCPSAGQCLNEAQSVCVTATERARLSLPHDLGPPLSFPLNSAIHISHKSVTHGDFDPNISHIMDHGLSIYTPDGVIFLSLPSSLFSLLSRCLAASLASSLASTPPVPASSCFSLLPLLHRLLHRLGWPPLIQFETIIAVRWHPADSFR